MTAAGVLLAIVTAAAAAPSTEIKVDQVGYLPDAPKVAFVVSDHAAGQFQVVRQSDGVVVLRGTLGAAAVDADSDHRVRPVDFTSLTTPGTYVLAVDGVGSSWPFVIGSDVYRRAYYLSARSYYGQRCGTAIDLGPEFPGYKHAACHLTGAFHTSSGKTGPHASAKGWHDAGDYGRYVVNSGIATGTLLMAYELYSRQVSAVSLQIPESGNGTADLLNEARWNLDWMLSMQDEDGGVWQKQTSERFPGFVMPEADSSVSYVIGTGHEPFKSSCATADLAAVAAIASRVFNGTDQAYADKALAGARKAWGWLDQHPHVSFLNPQGVSTGEYGDGSCADERFWAAAELWSRTGTAADEEYVLAHYREFLSALREVGPPSWNNVAALGLWSYALSIGGHEDVRDEIKHGMLAAADAIAARTAANPYRTSLTTKDYVWGSNAVAANYAMQLMIANRIRPTAAYRNAALENLHYLFGRNAFSISFVTGLGTYTVTHPHHRPSGADANAAPWPGLLVGGPNARKQDPAMQRMPDMPPALMFLDDQASYASNEIAINWNAPLVFVLAGVLPGRH
jgi:endoglucanase